MSPLSVRIRKQPQASTSAPQPVLLATGPSTDPPQNDQGPSGGRFSEDAIADMKAMALDITQTITSVVTEVADVIPVPGLKIGLLGLAAVVEKIQGMQENVEGVATLKQRVGSLVEGLRELHAQSGSHPLPPSMKVKIEALIESWTAIEERAGRIKSRGRIMRFLRSKRDAKKLGELIGEINDSIQDKIVLQGILNIERYMEEISKTMQKIRAHLAASFMPMYAKKAQFNSNEAVRRSCFKGTRVKFLERIYNWITAACAQGNAVPNGGIVLWINGLGGTGKTTVAHSVSTWCDKHEVLAGSFFCSRSDAECSDPNLIFLTLSRQLCHHHGPYKEKVEAVLERDPEIVHAGPFRQFEKLVVEPLEALDTPFPRSVFVLDALDECKDEAAKSTILSVIAKFVARIAKFLLFVITSRPEEHITTLFASRKDSLKDTTTPLLMHDIPLELALKDIQIYVDHEFEDHVGVLSIEPGWPSAEEKDALVNQSQGLFIYVATAIKFIMDKTYRDPKGQMLSLRVTSPSSSTPHEFLFALYSKILVASYTKASQKLAGRLRDVLGTIVFAQEALSTVSVARLVGLDVADVRNTLTGLHSVLHIPDEDDQPIRIIHPTFPEFLLTLPETPPLESSDLTSVSPHLRLQPVVQHRLLFSRCVVAMSGSLKRDMIGMRYPALFLSEVTDLKHKVNKAIEPHVSYACRFWGRHLRDGMKDVATSDFLLLSAFVHKELLYWIEACCLLEAVDTAVFALDTARNICRALGGQFADLVQLLADHWRFILSCSPCIHLAPLQIYHCALSIAPINSLVGNKYAHERQHALVVKHGSHSGWEPCIQAFEGHGGEGIYAVAFSQDGAFFATGGGDRKATVWKTATRTPIVSFDGHTDAVTCVAYAPDGLHVASGSSDRRVCVWQPSSGECVHTLKGHIDRVCSVAYSGDGRRIVSATYWGEVKLWDTTDGRCLLTLDRMGTRRWQVGFSPDGGVIARGDGSSLSLYNVASSSSEALEFPDAVEACVFSPDSRYIAARSGHVIRVWAWPGKSVVRSIDVAEELTSRLAFSRDGTLIGCGSRDGTVLLWQAASEDSPRTLQGHTSQVGDVAYSPDKSQAISVAYDGMIRVWDLTSSLIHAKECPALDLPSSASSPCFALIRSGAHAIALLDLPTLGIDAEHFPIGVQMPDGAPTATLFSDVVSAWDAALQVVEGWYGSTAARAWQLLTGQRHFQLSWRPFAILSDSTLMAYLSPTSNSVVDVCDLRTGAVVTTLIGHTGNVYSIAFSPDKSRLATGSEDCSVKIWDTATGDLLCGHTECRDWAPTVTFSPDGRLVASGSNSYGHTLCIFEIATERVVRVLDSHRGHVVEVMFAADNIHLMALDDSHWVCIYNVETGERIHEVSLSDDSWLHAPFFSPDGSGIFVGDGGTVALWNPGTRTWPGYHITRDGWVYTLIPGKTQRLCWLPPEWRTPLRSEGSMLYVGEGVTVSGPREKRRVIVLDMSQLLEYIDALDARE